MTKNKIDNEGPVTGLMSDANDFWLRKLKMKMPCLKLVPVVGSKVSKWTCVDNNDCTADNLNSCHKWATCSNIPGSYQCVCNTGFTCDGFGCVDNDECTNGDNNCNADATCTNNDGSYTCACNAGYSGEGYDDDCTDIDECATDTNEYHDVATCTNTIGSYECTCLAAYEGTGRGCANIYECTVSTQTCTGDMIECDDRSPGFTCRCVTGYELDVNFGSNEYRYLDFDECDHATDRCHDYATSGNTIDSNTCECNTDFAGDGFECADINECDHNPCDAPATCTNSTGSFSCACNYGWSGDGFTCH